MKTPLLELYYFDTCPYCQRVIKTIDELKVKVDLKDIHENLSDLQKLTYVTGRKTVPCLFIDGVPMHESQDIMNWLRANNETLEKVK